MRWFNAPRSLFYQLLLFFGLPLLALGGISIYTHYFSAMSAATLAYDRTLLASARTVAERLVVREGKLAVDVPYVVLDSFERNMNDQLYYEVISPQGKSISGYDDLPPLPPHIPRSTLYPALVHFYDAEYLGRPIRVAALFQPVNESGVSGMATILVAETLESRRYLARQMMIAALLSQGTVVVLTLILAFALLKRVLKPMRKLSGIMLRRDPGELTPLPRVLPWSEMQPLLVAFNRYIERLRLMVARQERFSADASHQLRTPLAVLRGELEALQDGVRQPTPASLSSLQAEVSTLTKLVDDLHQLSLSDLGALAYRKSSVDCVHLLQIAVAAFRERFRAKGLEIVTHLPPQAPLFGDPDRLNQLFNNLLENSLRYTDAGGRLEIGAELQPGRLLLYWQDSAPGISDQQLTRIFERFYRAEGSRNRASGGSGLGLAICHNIVEAHDGKIRAEHSPLGGVRITVEFATPIKNKAP